MNILHGIPAAKVFKEAFDVQEEEILIFNDVLSCGPLKEYTDMESWKVFREEYWRQLDTYNYEDRTGFGNTERDFYEKFDDFKSADSLKLWIGTGLGDQLLLAFVVHLIDYCGLDMQKLSVYQFEKIARKHFDIEAIDVAILRVEEVKNHPVPFVLTEAQIVIAKSAWEAVTSPTPEKYLKYLHSDVNNLFLLTKSMAYLFLRYPNVSTGLSYLDEALLEHTKPNVLKAARIIGNVFGYEFIAKNSLDTVGDFYLFGRLKNLGKASLNRPLIKANVLNLPMRETEIHILPDGIKTLSGELNMIQENGIDDWVCGVHLDSSSDGVWVRDGKKLVWNTYKARV